MGLPRKKARLRISTSVLQEKGKNAIPRACLPRCFINHNMALGMRLACKETGCSLVRQIVGLQLLLAKEVVLVFEELDS